MQTEISLCRFWSEWYVQGILWDSTVSDASNVSQDQLLSPVLKDPGNWYEPLMVQQWRKRTFKLCHSPRLKPKLLSLIHLDLPSSTQWWNKICFVLWNKILKSAKWYNYLKLITVRYDRTNFKSTIQVKVYHFSLLGVCQTIL